MEMINNILTSVEYWIMHLGNTLPIEVFAAVGSLIEEIIAPIPSPLVMTLAGSLIESQQKGIISFILVGLISAAFKTLAQWFFYFLAEKTEDLASSKMGKVLGFSVKDIEYIGTHFKGGIRDEIVIFLGRAIPLLPSAVISVGAGFIRIDLMKFLRASFLGNFVRSLFFMAFGYYSYASYETLNKGVESFESIGTILFALLGVVGIGFILYMRKKVDKHQASKISEASTPQS